MLIMPCFIGIRQLVQLEKIEIKITEQNRD